MNLTLHWLRRDLRRHAPALALWALLVAAFTWARIWLRTHPHFFIGDRDLWLSVPAAALGFAEVCLLLRVLLDDPARGPHAFWKTRPPSGGAVFAAKAIICALAALVIPFAAEGVFLAVVGPSAGTPERTSLYLLPPVLALTAGAVASSWKSTLLWLPVVIGTLACGIGVLVWLGMSGRLEQFSDHRLISLTMLLTAVAGAAWMYRRRTDYSIRRIAVLLAPAAAGLGMAATGWPRDARLSKPPPGMNAAAMQVTWLQQPDVSRNYDLQKRGLSLPLRIKGLPARTYADATMREVMLQSEAAAGHRFTTMNEERHVHGYNGGDPGAFFHVLLSEDEAASLAGKSWTVTGTLVLRVFDRTHRSLALDRTHKMEAGDCRWVITPAVSGSARRWHHYDDLADPGVWYEYEFLSTAPLPKQEWTFIDRESAVLCHVSGPMNGWQMNFSLGQWFLTWEGLGRGGNRLGFGEDAVAKGIKDPANWKDWTLEFDTLTLAGTMEVPFTLRWPADK